MKRTKIAAILLGIFMLLAIVTLSLGPTWNVEAGQTPQNVAADIMLWITFGYVLFLIAMFLVMKIRGFIRHTIMKKQRDEDLDEFVIQARSYRNKFDE